ncbi:MAG: response regulator [Patescibacteria group bacterium]|jgi:DNA-binding response OmpR family regulator
MIKKDVEKTILVIEDERPLLEAIRTKLEKNNFSVVTARTAEQAYGLLEDLKKIDIIWLDHYLLGKENGLDIVTKLKGHEKYRKIPIFIVSNTASADKVKSYINLGINKYYTKSNYRLDQIIGDIRDCLK